MVLRTSDFAIGMLEAFEEFDKNLTPPGLITQQFTALAQKCAEKGVKLLIGEKDTLGSIQFPKQIYDRKYIFVNFSENLVKKAMLDPIYVIQQEGKNVPEIKAIPLGNLVAKTMVADFNDPVLIGKCAAYLLFHELFHANSFLDHVKNYDWNSNKYNETMYHSISKYVNDLGISKEQVELMLGSQKRYDDLRNVTGAKTETETRVPGEYELLKALCPNKNIMRLYEGKFLDFSDLKVLNAAVKVAQIDFPVLNDDLEIKDLFERYLQCVGKIIYSHFIENTLSFFDDSKKTEIRKVKNFILASTEMDKKIISQEKKELKEELSTLLKEELFNFINEINQDITIPNSLLLWLERGISFHENGEVFLGELKAIKTSMLSSQAVENNEKNSNLLNVLKSLYNDIVQLEEFSLFDESYQSLVGIVKIDNSIWKAQTDQYMQEITKKLEDAQMQKDMQNKTYIPID